MKHIIFITLFTFVFTTSCYKKYTCECVASKTTCTGCYASNEPLSSTTFTTMNYGYRASSASKALSKCNSEHQADISAEKGGTSYYVTCTIK